MLAFLPVALLPAVTFLAAWYALRPARRARRHAQPDPPVTAAGRLAVVRAVVVVAAYAVVSVELLSAIGWLTTTGVVVTWLLGLVAAVAWAVLRARREPSPLPWPRWPRLGPVEWLMALALLGLALGTLVIAVMSPPNNWDSVAYHLPRVEEWAQAGSVGAFPINFTHQIALPPGAEYLLLHLRLLTHGDRLYNLVQWNACLLCGLALSRVAAQLGAGRFGQLFAALLFAAAPAVVLEATSTQVDLVAAAWAACAATLVLDAAIRRPRLSDVGLLGATTGLAALTKPTALVAVGVLMALWFVHRAWRVRSVRAGARLAAASLGIAAVAFVICAPFLVRVASLYGNPLGPPEETIISMGRHDPSAVSVNAARLLQTTAMVPQNQVNDAEVRVVRWFARALGANLNDPDTSRGTYPLAVYPGPDEDAAPYPVPATVAALGLLGCVLWKRRDPTVIGYAAASLMIGIGLAATVRWQPFANRLLLSGLVVAVPLAGLAADGLRRGFRRPAARAVVSVVLALVVGLASWDGARALAFGRPRALYGDNSVLTTDQWSLRFERIPGLRPDYWWATNMINAAGADRVGIVEDGYWDFEYPWWVMLKGHHIESLRSTVPGHPPASPATFDAIICFDLIPPDCHGLVPPGWQVQVHSSVAVALPPR